MTDDKKLALSRRKLLGGLGSVGLAGAGAGLGTTALFSDEETFEDNSITAGTLDMSVTASVKAANEYWENQTNLSDFEETADGGAVTGLQVEDAKPGDWAIICFDISIGENPGYVQVSTESLTSNENGYTEPEPKDDNGEGELEEAILATVWQGPNSPGSRPDLTGLDGTTNNAGGTMDSHSWDSSRTEGGEVDSSVHYTTLQEAYDQYQDGVVIGQGGTPTEVGSGADAAEFCLLLEIPSEVGNEIQSDSVSLDLVFETEQVRNNDDPFEPSEPPIIAQTDADETIPVRELGESPNKVQHDALEGLDLSDPFTLAVENPALAGDDSTDYAVTAFYDQFDESPNDRLFGPSTPLEFNKNGIASVTIGSSGTGADVTTWIAPGSLSGDASLVNNIEVPDGSTAIAVETE